MTKAKEACNSLSYRGQATCTTGWELQEGLSHPVPFRPVSFFFFFNSLELALQVHVTFNVALNWIPISSKHFFPKGFPTEVFAGQRSLSNTVFKRLFRKTGLYPPIRMSHTGCEEWDSHAGGNGTLLDSFSDLQVAECRHARCLRSLRARDPCAGLCRERLLSYFLTQIFPNLQMKVSEPRPFLELSHWLGCPQGYAHRDSSCSQLRLWQWQPSLSPILPLLSTQGFFSFLSVFFSLCKAAMWEG